MVKEIDKQLHSGPGSMEQHWEWNHLVSFLGRCNTPSSREAIYKSLHARDPYLREQAIRWVPLLRMEKAVRLLPELFDDRFVLGTPYRPGAVGYVPESKQHTAEQEAAVPSRRVCDEAAEAFTKVVPDAPRYVESTVAEQQHSIETLKRWWKENSANLKWDERSGTLARSSEG